MLMSSADSAPLFRGVICNTVYFSANLANLYIIRKGDLQKKQEKKKLILTSVGEAGSRMIRANIDTFRQIGDCIHFKARVTLIRCVFSGSDVGSK